MFDEFGDGRNTPFPPLRSSKTLVVQQNANANLFVRLRPTLGDDMP
jgi:hypothetical protein